MKTHSLLKLSLAAVIAITASISHAGSVARLFYDGVTGTTVGSLTNALIFPNSPTFREQLDDFTLDPFGAPVFGLQGKDNSFIDFGSYVRGYIEVPANGIYTLSLASDDASELWFSTNHIATNATRVAQETVGGAPLFSGARLTERTSVPFTLVRGEKYYFEALHKQGSGASYLQVGWQRPDGTQEIIPALHLAQHPLDPWEGRNNPNLAPIANASGLNGGNLLANTNATEGGSLLLQVDVIAAQPTIFQWLSNGVPIAGENLSFLRWTGVPLSADGANISVTVSNAFGTWTSAATTLAVTPDATPLGVALVDHRGNPNGLRVTFTKPVNPATATNFANYALDGGALTINSATLLANQTSVQLAGTFNFAVDSTHTLTIQNVEDTAVIPNGLAPNPTNIVFSYSGANLGPIGFAANLSNLSVLENRPVRLEVTPSGALPYTYQWLYEGSPISGATNRALTFLASFANAGQYQVVVSNEFSFANSATAALTVLADTVPPKLISVRGFAGGLNEVRIKFDELLDPITATNLGTYRIGYLPIYSATLAPNGSNVVLRTANLLRDQVYLLEITGLRDPSAASNTLNTTAAFVAQVDYVGELLVDAAVRHFKFDEQPGSATVESVVSVRDALASTPATLIANPQLGVPGVVPADPDGTAIEFTATNLQRIAVPNGSDLNASAGPWAKKSFEFWFRANSVPAPGTTGLAATAGLWEEGAATRNIAVYLWRDPNNPDPNSAHLVLNAVNNAANDGAGSPYGPPGNPAVYALAPVQAGQTYHVVAVFDGDATGTNGNLIIYLNGVEAAHGGGVGQIYNHTGDIRIGHGNGLIHTGQNGAFGYFDGVLDALTAFNRALSPQRVAAHFAAGSVDPNSAGSPLLISDVDTRGNPNQVLVTFNKPVTGATANDLANFSLQRDGGPNIPISSATLLAGERTVQLVGAFNLQPGSNYVLTVGNVTDQAQPPGLLTPSPTNVAFTFAAPAPASYDNNGVVPDGLQLYGTAAAIPTGSHDGSGYLRLTDAVGSQNGYALFTERHDVEQFHLSFKARISDTSSNAADGFSVNLAADLPTATFGTPEEGYAPLATITQDRLIVAFDNFSNNSGDASPSIAVKWRGVVLANVLTGTNGIPTLHNNIGAWVNVDVRLRRGGWLSVVYDNVVVISNLFTGIEVIPNAQLGLAARTGGSYETHWFDDIVISYADGSVGPVGVGVDSELTNITAVENQIVRYSIAATGAGPFGYQWYWNGAPIPGATQRVLSFAATTNLVGQYHAVVFNEFSQATSPAATLAVDTDFTPPAVQRVVALAGSLNEIRIWFNEPVDAATATNIANYFIASLPVLSAGISSNGTLVILRTGPQTFQQTNVLHISGVKDRSSMGNSLNGQVAFATTVSYADEVLADLPVRYFRLDETNGVTAFSLTSLLDALPTTPATYTAPLLNQPSLVPNTFDNGAVRLRPANSARAVVPSGSDLNINTGPWEKKTVEFWFRANSVPAPGTTGANAAAGLYEQGAGSRGLSIYLFRDPANTNASEADLYFNAWNNVVADGLGSPYGVPGTAKFVRTTISTGVTYHVVAVFDGGTNIAAGQLVLYTNGVEVGRQSGVGRLYNHNSDIQIGRGNTLLHTATTTTTVVPAFFDGFVDEVSLYNTALSSNRVATHYWVGNVYDGPPAIESIRLEGGNIVIRWSGQARLETAPTPNGPYTEVPGATSPFQIVSQPGNAFFRLTR
jgi:hypothetical protein